MTIYELTLFKKMVRVKTRSLLFCLRYDPLIVFRKQNHKFHFYKTMSHDLELQWRMVVAWIPVVYSEVLRSVECLCNVLSRCWVVAWWFDRWRRKWGTFPVGYIMSVPSFTKNCSYVGLNAKYRPLFSYHRKKEWILSFLYASEFLPAERWKMSCN